MTRQELITSKEYIQVNVDGIVVSTKKISTVRKELTDFFINHTQEILALQSAPINEVKEDKEQGVNPFDFNQLDTDIKRMFPMGNNIKKLIEEEANKQGIFEPKYGGKDHSGYDTLIKYEVNSYLEDYFEKGALWIVEKLTEKIKNLPQTYGEKGLGKVYDIAINDVLNLLK